MNWEDILSQGQGQEGKKGKVEAIDKVNKKVVEATYKDVIATDENLTTLRIKIHLLSKDGEWVEVGTFSFSKEGLANIADYVRDIILTQVEDLSKFNLGGVAKVRYVVFDENSSKSLLRNTISIVIPKELLRERVEEKKTEVIEKVETSVWEGIEKFIELNRTFLDSALKMKDVEKKQLEEIFQKQLEELNRKIKELQQAAPKEGEREKAFLLLAELQKLRDEFERKLIELRTSSNPLEKVAVKVLEKTVEKAFSKEERKDDPIVEYLFRILQTQEQEQATLLKELLQKELHKDPTNEIERVARLVKELKDKDTGEDIKNELSRIVLEIAKKKMSEDPLEDLKRKVELITGIVKSLRGDEDKLKNELQQQINELKNLLLTQQMQQYDFHPEEPQDPLEKLEKETERIAKIYERMEKLFGKREPASKTLLETIKEVLSSPTVVEIAKTFIQGIIQMQQMQAQMQLQFAANPMLARAYAGYVQPKRKVRKVVRKPAAPKVVSQQKNIIQPQPQPQPQQTLINQQIPQPVLANMNASVEEEKAENNNVRSSILEQAEKVFKEIVIPKLEQLKNKKKTSKWEKQVVEEITKDLLSIEQEHQYMAKMMMENPNDLLQFKKYIDEQVASILGISNEQATRLADMVIQRMLEQLS